MITNKNGYAAIDITKYIFATFIVAIHFTAFSNVRIQNTSLFNVLNLYVFDFAVPFFFVTSGYLLFKKAQTLGDFNGVFKEYFYRLLKPYLFWGFWYFAIGVLTQLFNGKRITYILLDKIKLLFFSSPGGGLWYVQSLLILLILLRLVRFNGSTHSLFILIVIFGIFALLCDSIFDLSGYVNWASEICNSYNCIFVSRLNFVFYGVYFLLGGGLYRFQRNINLQCSALLLISMYIIYCVCECLGGYIVFVSHFFKLFIPIVILLICVKASEYNIVSCSSFSSYCRDASSIMYFLHFSLVYAFGLLSKILGVSYEANCTVFFFCSIILLNVICLILRNINYKKTILKYIF